MRRLNPMILGTVLLCAATAAWAADPTAAPPTTSAAAEESLVAPMSLAPVTSSPISPAPVAIDLLSNAPRTAAIIPCPAEPITTCNDCFYFGQYLTYSCTTFCQNGVPRRVCNSCGSGCNP